MKVSAGTIKDLQTCLQQNQTGSDQNVSNPC